MPPRIPLRTPCGRALLLRPFLAPSHVHAPGPSPSPSPSLAPPSSPTRAYATEAPTSVFRLPEGYIPPTRPPTSRAPDSRKAQLIRTYTSLLRSTPLILFFQHNNLTGPEWAAVRRELRFALGAVPTPEYLGLPLPVAGDFVPHVQIQIIRTRMFDRALRILEFFDPATVRPVSGVSALGRHIQVRHDHDLSRNAYRAVLDATGTPDPSGTRKNLPKPLPEESLYAQLQPLLVGPMALLTLPGVSPAHLAAALGVLAPSAPAFPAPTRKKRSGYHDATAQSGLRKLVLVGGRIEGNIFDTDGVKWVGGIEGGLDGLRAQLLRLLYSAGLALTAALEGAGKNLWLTIESRRSVMEEEQKGPAGTKEEEEKKEE